jgi:GDP-4-dehydro-6-deoxy-D-mannose reductase
MRRVLITGISGFAGSHLVEFLLSKKKYNISGTYLIPDNVKKNLGKVKSDIRLIQVDLTNSKKVDDLLNLIKPDFVFHLAALPYTAASFKAPFLTMKNNIASQMNVLSAIKDNNLFDTKVLVVSSGEIYGLVEKEDLPIDEETKLMPTSPYAVSKIAQDFLGLQYFLSYKLKIIRVRPFNHIGPRQSPSFVVASIARKIAEIEKGKREGVISVGNLVPKRDFTDVRDMVAAYVLAIEKGKVGDVYNIGTEKSYKISEVLDNLLKLSKVKIKVSIDKNLLRPVDIPELLCDATKFRKLTNWRPKIPITTTLKDTLDYWRSIV